MNTDSRVDSYIAKAPSFAQPILDEVRTRIRKACPAAEETIKWNVPFYVLDGKLLASMAAFKKHAKIGVWHGMKPEMVDVTSVAELPSAKAFAQSLAASMQHASDGRSAPSKKSTTKKALTKKALTKKAPAKRAAAKNTRKSGRVRGG